MSRHCICVERPVSETSVVNAAEQIIRGRLLCGLGGYDAEDYLICATKSGVQWQRRGMHLLRAIHS